MNGKMPQKDLARIGTASRLTEEIYSLAKDESNEVKTIVLRFPKDYFVFIVGRNSLRAFSLSTAKYEYFNNTMETFYFLKDKDILETHRFDGSLRVSEVRGLMQNKILGGFNYDTKN